MLVTAACVPISCLESVLHLPRQAVIDVQSLSGTRMHASTASFCRLRRPRRRLPRRRLSERLRRQQMATRKWQMLPWHKKATKTQLAMLMRKASSSRKQNSRLSRCAATHRCMHLLAVWQFEMCSVCELHGGHVACCKHMSLESRVAALGNTTYNLIAKIIGQVWFAASACCSNTRATCHLHCETCVRPGGMSMLVWVMNCLRCTGQALANDLPDQYDGNVATIVIASGWHGATQYSKLGLQNKSKLSLQLHYSNCSPFPTITSLGHCRLMTMMSRLCG